MGDNDAMYLVSSLHRMNAVTLGALNVGCSLRESRNVGVGSFRHCRLLVHTNVHVNNHRVLLLN